MFSGARMAPVSQEIDPVMPLSLSFPRRAADWAASPPISGAGWGGGGAAPHGSRRLLTVGRTMDDEPPVRASKLPTFHIENLLSSGSPPSSDDGSISPGTDGCPVMTGMTSPCRPPFLPLDVATSAERVGPPPPSAFTPLYSAQVQLAKKSAPSLHQLQLDWLARTGMLYSAPRLHLPEIEKLKDNTTRQMYLFDHPSSLENFRYIGESKEFK
ncbi:hypothetical protein GE061_004574 [Apolygus lucorum]|uniref:Uncharacterized protein n=1 Tax=Apolygus lucorum TaxID=248454 RepID=A0A6A4IV06_APOLU|nr:hypothetical protein GE061_004574 [Apolygus lucorum]